MPKDTKQCAVLVQHKAHVKRVKAAVDIRGKVGVILYEDPAFSEGGTGGHMRHKRWPFYVLALSFFAFSTFAYAHHGASKYDFSKTITLNGTITEFEWSNPHCLVHMDVMGDDGTVQHWTLELPSIFSMEHKGWDKDSLKPGDQALVNTHPAKNGVTLGISWSGGMIMKMVVNGKTLSS